MNRIAIVTELLHSTVPSTLTDGQLLITDTKGGIVKAGAAGPYVAPSFLELMVGTKGFPRQLGILYPNNFTFESYAYRAAVGRTIKVGYINGSAAYNTIDVTAAANIAKFGTLTVTFHSLTSSVIPAWGDMFAEDVQIASGETVASYRAKLVAKATKIAAAINAKYGSGTVSLTDSGSAGTTMLQFVFVKGADVTITIDGVFDGTDVTVSGGAPCVSGTTGPEVLEMLKESAILDGYNPVQVPKYEMFLMDQYGTVDPTVNYDGIVIHTVSNKQYESPGHPAGWDVSYMIYTPNSEAGTLGTEGAAIVALLTELKAKANGVYDMETATAAAAAFAAIDHTHE